MWVLFYTGGTTGFPKGVMITHRNFLTMALGSLATYPWVTPEGRMLHAAPMLHGADIIGWVSGNLLGCTQVILPPFDATQVLAAIVEHGVTDGVLVPTMIQTLVDHPDAESYDLGGLRHVVYGGSPVSVALLERAAKTLPNTRFLQTYGMTETSAIVTMQTPEEHDDPALLGTAGRAAVHAAVKIVDPASDEVPRGTVGEIVARGDNVMLGYWDKPEETAAALRDGWMHTGDIGYMDERGYVFVVDRLKDMIITGGENVYSTEVENALAMHHAVATAAVIGVRAMSPSSTGCRSPRPERCSNASCVIDTRPPPVPCRHARLSLRGQAALRRSPSGGRPWLRSRPPSCWASIVFV